jgi:hypothetical protein
MKLLTKEIEKKLEKSKLYSGEKNKFPSVIVKFFDPTGSWTWYATEGEKQEDGDWLFFGLVDGHEPELGYFSLNELKHCKDGLRGLKALPIERDMYFDGYVVDVANGKVIKASELEKVA